MTSRNTEASFLEFVGMVERDNQLDVAERKFHEVLRHAWYNPTSRDDVMRIGGDAPPRWRAVAMLGGTSLWDSYQAFSAPR